MIELCCIIYGLFRQLVNLMIICFSGGHRCIGVGFVSLHVHLRALAGLGFLHPL